MNTVQNLPALEEALRRAFPSLSPLAPLRLLGIGFGSLAVETPGGIVFRIARVPEAGAQYERQVQLLRVISTLPVMIPRPLWFVRSSSDFPFGLVGYRKLPGQTPEPNRWTPAERASFAVQIGHIIMALQRVRLDLLPVQADIPARQAEWARLAAVCLPALREALDPVEYRKIAAWWDRLLNDARMLDYSPVFIHGDLWYGNLLEEGKRLVGLVDFQEARIGDPAQDFVPQLYLGERFLRQVMLAYKEAGGMFDLGFEHRLTTLWGLREFGGLAYSIEHNDREEWIDSLEKIRKGPILSWFGLDGWSRR